MAIEIILREKSSRSRSKVTNVLDVSLYLGNIIMQISHVVCQGANIEMTPLLEKSDRLKSSAVSVPLRSHLSHEFIKLRFHY